MSRVEKNAGVTLVMLIHRSLRWLDWCMDGVDSSKQSTPYRWLIVGCDATDEVIADPRIGLDFRNDSKHEFYINRIYRAWNAGVLEAPTQNVIMLNSDMLGADYWIDELIAAKESIWSTVPTSRLVESGRLPSGMPEYVMDFGTNPDEFRKNDFIAHAASIRESGTAPGRLFMPILVDRQEFIDVGMYPEGNPPGTTGDKDLIRRYTEAGFQHVTVNGSVVYHVQLGEQRWP